MCILGPRYLTDDDVSVSARMVDLQQRHQKFGKVSTITGKYSQRGLRVLRLIVGLQRRLERDVGVGPLGQGALTYGLCAKGKASPR